jgi:FAD/FMN-containing dehydrogenase
LTADLSHSRGWTRRHAVAASFATAGGLGLGLLGHPANALAIGTVGDLGTLASRLHGRVLTPGTSGYDDARKVWNKAYDRRPLAMVRCADLEDVRRCMAFAQRHAVPVAIRGGGHSYAGFGVADGALQVDLRDFQGIAVDPAKRIASVGGGVRIRDLLAATLAVGLYTPMGSCGAVGVAGLALAGGDTGGRGMFGTACDNIVGAQLVTVGGEILELGQHQNEDLFWAIRGGGGNFGVVTRLDFRLYPTPTAQTVQFSFGWRDIDGAMRTFGDLVRETPDEIRAVFLVDADTGASASLGYYGSPHAAAEYLARWERAFPRSESRRGTSTPNPVGEVWDSTAVAVDGAFLERLDDGPVEALSRAALAGRGFGSLLMGLSNGQAARIGIADTAYPLRGTGLSSLLSATWERPEDRERSERWVAEFGAALRPWARRAYVNYLGPSTPDRIREVYGANYARLARIKARYDPANLFRANQNILPGSAS